MKTVKGWRKIDNKRGFLNETTGQNLLVKKKEFGVHYIVMLFERVEDAEKGRKISPEFSTEAKAEAYAMDWMSKHPKGEDSVLMKKRGAFEFRGFAKCCRDTGSSSRGFPCTCNFCIPVC